MSQPCFFIQLTVECQRNDTGVPKRIKTGYAKVNRYAYVTTDSTLYQYECSTEKWIELCCKSPPHHDAGLVIIDSELTTVGGRNDRYRPTNKLFTLRQRKWVEKYPPMNTACAYPAVVSTSDGNYLIVIGGFDDGGHWTATVELFQVKSRRWHKLTDLPRPLPKPSATICCDQLNVIGNDDNGYSCSLQALPSSDTPITSPLTLSWKPLPHLPVTESIAATLCGQLVIIGGREKKWSSVNSIHQLVGGKWVKIGSMCARRANCFALGISEDKVLIVGGVRTKREGYLEVCVVVTTKKSTDHL